MAHRHADIKRKRHDFLHKLSTYYATEYDLVAVEDLDAKGLIELDGNSRNRAGATWGTFKRMLEYKCERESTHFVAVEEIMFGSDRYEYHIFNRYSYQSARYGLPSLAVFR